MCYVEIYLLSDGFLKLAAITKRLQKWSQSWVEGFNLALACLQCGSLKQCEAALEEWEAAQQMDASFFEEYVSQYA